MDNTRYKCNLIGRNKRIETTRTSYKCKIYVTLNNVRLKIDIL